VGGGGSVIETRIFELRFHQHVHLEGQFFHCQAQRAATARRRQVASAILGWAAWVRAGRLLCRESRPATDDRSGW
jgi:hypothetical protein